MTETTAALPAVFDSLFATTSGGKNAKNDWDAYVADNFTAMVEAYELAGPHEKQLIEAAFSAVTAYGFSGRTKSTLQNLRAEVKRKEALKTAAQRLEVERSLKVHTTVWDALSGAHPPPKYGTSAQLQALTVPYPYRMTANGVDKGVLPEDSSEVEWKNIAPSPIFPVSRTTDSVTGAAERMLVWRGPNGWRRQSVPREIMLDSTKIIVLAGQDAPVSSPRARDVVEFLDAFEAANGPCLEDVQVAHRCGWTDRGDFVSPGGYWVSPTTNDERPLTFIPEEGMEVVSAGWKQEGTWEGWLEAVDLIRDKPIMWTGLYAACAGPLLKVLGSPGWITDVSGETSHGKTTWLKFAASAGGRPSMDAPSIIGSWDQTAVYIEHVCAFHNNLPVFLDETKRARHRSIVRDIAYQFWQGQGRGRGKKQGVRETMTWQTTMLTTGEESAINFSQDAGTRARIVSIRGKPMGESSAENGQRAEELTYLVEDNYGHLLPRLMDQIVPIMNDDTLREALRDEWKKRRQGWAQYAGTGVGRRLAGYVAVMELVSDMIHGRAGFPGCGVPEPTGLITPFDVLRGAIEKAGEMADIPSESLKEALSWSLANRNQFWSGGATSDEREFWGIWNDNPPGGKFPMVAVRCDVMRTVIGRQGFPVRNVLDDWAARGYIDTGSNKGLGQTVTYKGQNMYVYVFTEAAWSVLYASRQGG